MGVMEELPRSNGGIMGEIWRSTGVTGVREELGRSKGVVGGVTWE